MDSKKYNVQYKHKKCCDWNISFTVITVIFHQIGVQELYFPFYRWCGTHVYLIPEQATAPFRFYGNKNFKLYGFCSLRSSLDWWINWGCIKFVCHILGHIPMIWGKLSKIEFFQIFPIPFCPSTHCFKIYFSH